MSIDYDGGRQWVCFVYINLNFADEVLLIWEPAIVKPFKNADISLSVKPEELNDAFETNTTTVKDLDSQISGLETHEEQAEHLERYLAHSVGCQNLIATCESYPPTLTD